MFTGFFRDRKAARAAHGLYMTLVEQSRKPVFYSNFNVPDSVDGRFDMVCLHMALTLMRLRTEGRGGAALAQALFDTMFIDIDRSVREMGIGDLSVPRHVKRMMRSLKGRCAAYALAWESDSALEDALRRNLYGTIPDGEMVATGPMASYMRLVRTALNEQDFNNIKNGIIEYPEVKDEKEQRTSHAQPRMAALA